MSASAKPINTLVADSVNPAFKSSNYNLSNSTDVSVVIDALASTANANKAALVSVTGKIEKAVGDLDPSNLLDSFVPFLKAMEEITGADVAPMIKVLNEASAALKAATALHNTLSAVDGKTQPSTVLAHVHTFAQSYSLKTPLDTSVVTKTAKANEDKLAASAPAAPTIVLSKDLDLTKGTRIERACAIMEAYKREKGTDLDYDTGVKYLIDAQKGGNDLKNVLSGWTITM